MSHLDLHPLFEHYRKEIEATLKPVIRITATPGKTSLWQSKFGGKPYIPKGAEYPMSKTSNRPLMLLAQINFEEILMLEPFPTKGILQVFISDDYDIEGKNLWGKNESDLTDQSNFRVLYYSDIIKDEIQLITDFNFLPKFNFSSEKEYQLQFKQGVQSISSSDYRYDEIFNREEIRMLIKNGYTLPFLGHEFSSQLGGYHYSQNDIDPKYFYFDKEEATTLLLQIDGGATAFSWGDGGTACFFITEKDLKNLDFSNVIYNWDCT